MKPLEDGLVEMFDHLDEPHVYLDPAAYESPLEWLFAHHAEKYFRRGVRLEPQRTVLNYRMDFVVDRVGFECDGWAWHSTQTAQVRDLERDAKILATGAVDALYRLPGYSLVSRPADCFFAISRWDPQLFSDRGLVNLEHLASPEVRVCFPSLYPRRAATVAYRYAYADDEMDETEPPRMARFEITRRC